MTIHILALILLVALIFVGIQWDNLRRGTQELQKDHRRLVAALDRANKSYTDYVKSSWDSIDRLHDELEALQRTNRALKGDKENLLAIIKDRNETLQLHKDRDVHHAAQLQVERKAVKAWFDKAVAARSTADALQVRVKQQEQALKAQQETIKAMDQDINCPKNGLHVRNTRQANWIMEQKDTIKSLETRAGTNLMGLQNLTPVAQQQRLEAVAEVLKELLNRNWLPADLVGQLGGRLSRAVQVYRKANPARVTVVSPTMQIIHGSPEHTV